jgi:hypothetical protein
MFFIDTPKAFVGGMPYRAIPSRVAFVALRSSAAIAALTRSASGASESGPSDAARVPAAVVRGFLLAALAGMRSYTPHDTGGVNPGGAYQR